MSLKVFIPIVLSGVNFAGDCLAASVSTIEHDFPTLESILNDQALAADWRDDKGNSLIYFHLTYGSEERAAELLAHTKRSTSPMMEPRGRLMDLAIRRGAQRLVKGLLARGEAPNAVNEGELSPLMVAAERGELEIMRMLLRAGADPNYAAKGQTAAHLALRHEEKFAFYVLLNAGYDLKKQALRTDGGNLLFTAVDAHLHTMIPSLVEAGFDPNRPRLDGKTVLHHAAERDNWLAIVVLLSVGADPCIRDASGKTAPELYASFYAKTRPARNEGPFQQVERCKQAKR